MDEEHMLLFYERNSTKLSTLQLYFLNFNEDGFRQDSNLHTTLKIVQSLDLQETRLL